MKERTQNKLRSHRLATGIGILALLTFLLFPSEELCASAISLTLHDVPLRYSLPEGETTLIVRIPKTSLLERFALVNENSRIHGEFRIAVAGSRLPVNDPKWNAVTGNIAFVNKRFFNLSMVGVEAKYVKLSFHVEKENRIADAGL